MGSPRKWRRRSARFLCRVSESFGPTLEEWLSEASPGKRERLSFLLTELGLADEPAGTIRYQLLHRVASAVVTADQ
jgi:hypothetical protein